VVLARSHDLAGVSLDRVVRLAHWSVVTSLGARVLLINLARGTYDVLVRERGVGGSVPEPSAFAATGGSTAGADDCLSVPVPIAATDALAFGLA